jgi:ribosome biogenesis ATPase
MENRAAVYVIAATNRPDIIDPAMLRPGRLDKLLYVQLPTKEERLDILKTLSKKTPLGPDVDMETIAFDHRCENFSGADLASLVREAATSAVRIRLRELNAMGKAGEKLAESYGVDGSSVDQVSAPVVTWKDFDAAFDKVAPSVSPQDKLKYDKLHIKLGGGGNAAALTAESSQAKKQKQKMLEAKKARAMPLDGDDPKQSKAEDSDSSL